MLTISWLIFRTSLFQLHNVPPFRPQRSFDSSFRLNTSLWSCIKIIKCTTSYRPHLTLRYIIFTTGKDQGGIFNHLDVLTKPLGWVLYPYHTRRTLEHFPSFIIFLLYFLFDSYIDTFIVLLLKIREGVVLRTSPTYIHSIPVPSKGTDILIIPSSSTSVSIFIPIGTSRSTHR